MPIIALSARDRERDKVAARHVQDMVELLARLEGEMSRDGIDGAGRVGLIILNNQGTRPLGPEVFREAARRKALERTGA